jgi:UDP-N-acetylmuramoyl-tripeptide--D-alanyl-D-alanine ligase
MRLSDLGRIIKGCAFGKDVEFFGISTDSREIKEGELFVAIRGERFDGHDFAYSALEKGAVAVLGERKFNSSCVVVEDTISALLRWAYHKRKEFSGEVVGVLGAAGKTTTKSMLAWVFGKFYKVAYSPKSFNNFIGLSTTIIKTEGDEDFWILEIGANKIGEIRKLAKISMPNHLIYTRLGPEHLEGFGSTKNAVIEEYSAIPFSDGLVLINSESPFFPDGKFYTYGFSDADFLGRNLRISEDGVRFEFEGVEFFVPYPHLGFAENALAVVVFSKLMGLPLNEVSEILKDYRGERMRMERLRCGKLYVISDVYNSNPISVDALLKSVHKVYYGKKIVFVFGDMLELGDEAEFWHRWVGKKMCLYGISAVVGFGGLSRFVLEEAKGCGLETFYAKTHKECSDFVLKGNYDVAIVKGSRGMEMEKVVEELCLNI